LLIYTEDELREEEQTGAKRTKNVEEVRNKFSPNMKF
jgi:hypothetical protein